MQVFNKKTQKLPGYTYIFGVMSCIIAIVIASPALADDYFSIHSLDKRSSGPTADISDLSVFSTTTGQLPGIYSVDIYVNNEFIESTKVTFIAKDGISGTLLPEITKEQLVSWGVNPLASEKLNAAENNKIISDISEYIDGASVKIDIANQKLILNIPQIALKKVPRGYVSSELWNDGIPALMSTYTFTGSDTWDRNNRKRHNEFLSLRNGLNIGPWRLRNSSTYYNNKDSSAWNNLDTYLERSLISTKSMLTLGESSTSGTIFNSFQFIGAKIESDESMLPASQRGFAPIIRGIAKGSAKVTVRQNGNILYETYVPAGPFEIDDLYSTAYSGDLEVSVDELNGTVQKFVVPFSSVPIMQREGQLKYSMVSGKYRSNLDSVRKPNFIQITAEYGLPFNVTAFGGSILSQNYQAVSVGSGLNMGGAGAISIGITNAKAKIIDDINSNESSNNGQSYNIQYSKSVASSGTTFALGSYRYSTDNYYDFDEANNTDFIKNRYSKKTRLQVDISQSFYEYGHLYVSAYNQEYWNREGKETTISSGYSNSYNSISYNINYSFSKLPEINSNDHVVSIGISIPINSIFPNSTVYSSASLDNNGRNNIYTGVSGTSSDYRFTYNAQQNYGNQGQNASGGLSGGYKGNHAVLNAGYNYDDDSNRINYGVRGGILLYNNGLILTQPLNDTIAVVEAPGADGADILGYTGVEASRGVAVIPYVSPYQKNIIRLNTERLGENVDVINNTVTVIPTRGAVVLAKIDTRVGYRALVKLNHNNKTLPFGAIVTVLNNDNKSHENTGIVDDKGMVYLSGIDNNSKAEVSWGKAPDQQCTADLVLPENLSTSILKIEANCVTR